MTKYSRRVVLSAAVSQEHVFILDERSTSPRRTRFKTSHFLSHNLLTFQGRVLPRSETIRLRARVRIPFFFFFFSVHSVFERCPFSNKNGHEVCYRFLYSMTSTGEMWLIVILSAWTGLGSENSTRRLLLSASPQQHSHTHTQAFWSSRFSNQLLTRKCGTCSSDRSVLASVLTSSAAPELRLFSLDLASARLSLLNTRRSRVICVPTPGAFTCKTVLRARVLPELGALMIRVRDFR